MNKLVLVITCLRGNFGINLQSSLFLNYEIENLKKFRDLKISKNERGKFSPNFRNKHVIPG